VKLDSFRNLVRRFAEDIPSHYLDGIVAIDVSPRTVLHPVRLGVYTLGECIPLHGDSHEILSRVVLYHGSFAALAREREDFDWSEEGWETLLHELRHHLEWRANTEALEAYDAAAEQNFARAEGRPFDPLFYHGGEVLDEGVFRVDDDVFVERVVRALPKETELVWRGRRYCVAVPPGSLPRYLLMEGVTDPPAGDLVLVFRSKPRVWDLLRPRREASIEHVRVDPID
jgi:hypothetical protein